VSHAAERAGDTRLRRERRERLLAEMTRREVPAMLLLGRAAVQYATGASWHGADAGYFHQTPTFALVTLDDDLPHLFTPSPDEAPVELAAAGRVHESLHLECAAGVRALGDRLRSLLGTARRLAVDEATAPMHLLLSNRLPDVAIEDAMPVVAAARIVKTRGEIECLRRAQGINDRAMLDVQAALRPGIRPCDLSGLFLRRIFELGASGNVVDPIWQPMPARIAAGPLSVNGDVVFPLPSGDRPFESGDVVWVDTGISCGGYVSDFGRTWIVGDAPDAGQRAAFERWREVVDRVLDVVRAGATGADLTRAARAVEPRNPWLRHLYLAHGAGLDSAEMPLVGTDLGEAFDERLVLAAGMVLVLEPVVWEEGHAGHRAEEILVVTETGHERLSDHGYAPFA
jgi:Xaa-Pro dipeptidase